MSQHNPTRPRMAQNQRAAGPDDVSRPVNKRLPSRDVAPGWANAPAPDRLLLVVVDGFNPASILDLLHTENRNVTVRTWKEAVARQSAMDEFGAVILCSPESGHRNVELLAQITERLPSQPVIVVTAPTMAGFGPPVNDAAPIPARTGNPIDGERLLSLVRDALRGPRIKRLIRVSGSQGTSFIARNARWLSGTLQARYSATLSPPPVPLSLPIEFTNDRSWGPSPI